MSRPRIVTAALLTLALAATPAGAQTTTGTSPGSATTPGAAGSTVPEITAEQAGPGILIDAADRVELASTLAEATEESGVCFGYVVRLGGSGASDREETLSNAGPDRQPTSCQGGTVLLQVSLTYTSESSESEDSASYSIATDVPGLTSSLATKRVKDLSDVDDDDLLGDKDDLALRNLTAALPLILDGAEPAELAAPAAQAPNGDRLTGSPGSDWMRENGLGIGVAFVLLIVAVGLVVGGVLGRRKARGPRGPKPPSRPNPSLPRDDSPPSPSTTT